MHTTDDAGSDRPIRLSDKTLSSESVFFRRDIRRFFTTGSVSSTEASKSPLFRLVLGLPSDTFLDFLGSMEDRRGVWGTPDVVNGVSGVKEKDFLSHCERAGSTGFGVVQPPSI